MAKKEKLSWPRIIVRHLPENDSLSFDVAGMVRLVPLLGQEMLSVLIREIAQLATTLSRPKLTITLITPTEKRILTISQSGEVTVGSGSRRNRKQFAEAAGLHQHRQFSWQDAIDSTQSSSEYVTWGQVTSTKENSL